MATYPLSLGADPTVYLVPANLREAMSEATRNCMVARAKARRTGDVKDFLRAVDHKNEIAERVRACPKAFP
jgi:hypothetical protein